MKIFRLITCFAVVFTLSFSVNAQKNFSKDADKAFDNEQYFTAVELYKKAEGKATKASDKAKINFRIGECYRNMTDADQAETYYKRAIKLKYESTDATVLVNLADVQKEQGNYKDAADNYEKYKSAGGGKRAEDGLSSCNKAQEWIASPTRFQVASEIVLNTPEYDFSTTFADKRGTQMVFTSSRKGATGDKADPRTGENYQDLWITTRDKKGKWGEPVPMAATINSEDNEGSACFDNKKTTMYLTRCPNEKKQNLGCDIYTSTKKGTGWGEAVLMELKHPDSTHHSVGHPALSKDGKVLLFASDMVDDAGTAQGGKDLWMVVYDKRNKEWSKPTNLGPGINTPGDEMFPYLHADGTLYFASNGHVGMGGLDIFSAEKGEGNKWSTVANMQYPINSEAHDYGIIFDGLKKDKGFFTSNRNGGKGRDDIYNFRLPPIVFALECYVYNKDTKEPVANAEIKLVGTDNSSVAVSTDENGVFLFEDAGKDRYIKKETSYTIEVNATDYLIGKDQVSTVGLDKSTKFAKEFYIQYASVETVIRFPEVVYAYDKYELLIDEKANAEDSLNFLYATLTENPTIIVELQSHTDSRGSRRYNQTLAQNRAQSCVDYLIKKGIPKERMVPKGYGEDRLKNSDAFIKALGTEEEREAAHRQNRRTEFTVLSFDYNPSGDGTGTGGSK
jgi:peptidoglycan-associated lipoprotein